VRESFLTEKISLDKEEESQIYPVRRKIFSSVKITVSKEYVRGQAKERREA
jgi:hypothetical protein